MNKWMFSAGALAALAVLGGCADYGPRGHGGVAVAEGFGGYYDDFYGPYNDGYWGDDGYFYYSDRPGHFNRDDSRHFRRDGASGFHGVRVHPAPSAVHDAHPEGQRP